MTRWIAATDTIAWPCEGAPELLPCYLTLADVALVLGFLARPRLRFEWSANAGEALDAAWSQWHQFESPGRALAPGDNAAEELVALARGGDRAGFDALASCLMPVDQVAECWAGARRRLGLPA